MRAVGIFEVKTKLSELLRLGEPIEITRHKKSVTLRLSIRLTWAIMCSPRSTGILRVGWQTTHPCELHSFGGVTTQAKLYR